VCGPIYGTLTKAPDWVSQCTTKGYQHMESSLLFLEYSLALLSNTYLLDNLNYRVLSIQAYRSYRRKYAYNQYILKSRDNRKIWNEASQQ